jgi:predicted Rossmann fold nucleotide-binding protein DprA/Smf involved in DNA uptake
VTDRTDRSLAALLLTNRLVDADDAASLRAREFWRLVDALDDPAVLLDAPAALLADVSAATGLDADRLRARLASSTALALKLEELDQRGIAVLSPFDDAYASALRVRLGSDAPPVLHVAGAVRLLAQPGIGVVGSRSPADAATGIAVEAAQRAVERGLVTISGGAKGIDDAAMNAAYGAGGDVVAILADGLLRRVRTPALRRAIGEERVCVASPYKPDSGFSVGNAMGRNKVIYALSQRTFVVTADEGRGGTWEGAVEALRRDLGPVCVWTGEGAGPGNAALVARGACPVSALDELFADAAPQPHVEQLALRL